MEKNILIPGAGGFASINAIKSLRMVDYKGKLVTTDSDPLSAGFHLADSYYVVPRAADTHFFSEVLRIIQDENIGIILPTSGFDIVPYAEHKKELVQLGVCAFQSDLPVIEVCNDKYQFIQKTKNDFNLPVSYDDPSAVNEYPVFLKPRFGKGSRNSFICNSSNEMSYTLGKFDDMLIQEYLPGVEYTIDVLSDLNGKARFAVPRERISVKEGISFKGRVIKNSMIQEECLRLANYLGLKGPSCMQMKQDRDGLLKFIEVNPRMGGGTIMATLAGANIPNCIIKLANSEDMSIPPFEEITVLRYYEEIVIKEEKK